MSSRGVWRKHEKLADRMPEGLLFTALFTVYGDLILEVTRSDRV